MDFFLYITTDGINVTCHIHITNQLPMFHQHAFVILLWGILMSPLNVGLTFRISISIKAKMSVNVRNVMVRANVRYLQQFQCEIIKPMTEIAN